MRKPKKLVIALTIERSSWRQSLAGRSICRSVERSSRVREGLYIELKYMVHALPHFQGAGWPKRHAVNGRRLSLLQLARAQVVMHDEEAARKSYEDFLGLWKTADSDLPIYKEAKAEYGVLRKSAQ